MVWKVITDDSPLCVSSMEPTSAGHCPKYAILWGKAGEVTCADLVKTRHCGLITEEHHAQICQRPADGMRFTAGCRTPMLYMALSWVVQTRKMYFTTTGMLTRRARSHWTLTQDSRGLSLELRAWMASKSATGELGFSNGSGRCTFRMPV